jgi:hypothetical protein
MLQDAPPEGKLDQYKAALNTLRDAVIATHRYQTRIQRGEPRSEDAEQELSESWSDVAQKIEEFNPKVADLCRVKGWGFPECALLQVVESNSCGSCSRAVGPVGPTFGARGFLPVPGSLFIARPRVAAERSRTLQARALVYPSAHLDARRGAPLCLDQSDVLENKMGVVVFQIQNSFKVQLHGVTTGVNK